MAAANSGGAGRSGGQPRRRKLRGPAERAQEKGAARRELDASESISLPCFSMRDPYASLLLHGVKTLETRSHPMLQGVTGPCLLHVGHKTMDEFEASEFLWRTGLVEEHDIERVMRPPQGMQRGQVLGIVKLGQTRRLNEEERKLESIQHQVTSEAVGAFATEVAGAWWLRSPLALRGQPGVWRASVPANLVPDEVGLVERMDRPPSTGQITEQMPRVVVFDLDGVCWSPEMYQTKGEPPYRNVDPITAVNSAGEAIRLHPAVRKVWASLHALQSSAHNIRVAVASSSIRRKAQPLLELFEVAPGVRMWDVIDPGLFEMYYRKGQGKRPHLATIIKKTGVNVEDVLFMDDNRENIASVQELGCVAVHTPYGLSEHVWEGALHAFRKKRFS